jgi:hypothetical protein
LIWKNDVQSRSARRTRTGHEDRHAPCAHDGRVAVFFCAADHGGATQDAKCRKPNSRLAAKP